MRATRDVDLADLLAIGLEHHAAGRLDQADAIYQEILQLSPAFTDALTSAGLLAYQRENYQSAIRTLVRAIRVNPNHAVSAGYLGLSLLKMHQLDAAVSVLGRAVSLARDNAEFHRWLGLAEFAVGDLPAASEAFLSSLALDPANEESGVVLLRTIRKIIAGDDPTASVGIVNRLHDMSTKLPMPLIYDAAFLLFINGFHKESIAAFRRILDRDPGFEIAHAAIIDALFLHCPDENVAFAELEHWADIHAEPVKNEQLGHAVPQNTDRRIRIGFSSLHFTDANTFIHVWPGWFEGYDKSQFEIFAYVDEQAPLSTTRDFTSQIDHWRYTKSLADADLAEMIREDGIDILIDIYGRGPVNRMGVLARKPAPIQVAWGPISTGLKSVDYFLSDRTVIPISEFHRYVENIVWLPDSYFAWVPPITGPCAPSHLGHRNEVVFGSFNREVKLSETTLSIWAEILRNVPNSRLVFKGVVAARPGLQAQIREPFISAGIAPDRLTYLGTTDQAGHLAAYSQIDVHLDTFPEQGGVTTLEALWSGVPVVTWCFDNRILSRTGATIYETLGLTELTAHSREEYIDLAVKLAKDPRWRQEMRNELRNSLARSPLVDSVRYSQNLQSALRTMWKRHCAGEAPRHFSV